MTAAELRLKSITDLHEELRKQIKVLFKFKLKQGNDQLQANHLLKQSRRMIATIKTIIHEKSRKEDK